MSLLALDGVSVSYGGVKAVSEVSLHVDEGEIIGLIGPNGAGKSTTLHVIMGVVPVSDGRIRLRERNIAGMAPESIVRLGVSLVPEARHIFSRLTVEENLQLGMRVRRDRVQAQRDAKRLLERFPALGRFRGQPAGRLSGGEQQQLAIARALLSKPALILLDEPSLGLAPLLVRAVFELLEELRNEGATLLLVEQIVERTVTLADRTYLLHKGRIVFEGTREDYANAPRLGIDYLQASPTGAV
jgi:branched-chain amino acid transport system ATP-binding protein